MSIEMLPLLVAAIFILAALPGPGVLLTVARAINGGLDHASFTVIGILLGDIIFILLVTFGLKLIADSLSTVFIFIKYAGSAYLIWLGLSLLLSRTETVDLNAQPTLKSKKTTFISDVLTGLSVTLSNPKAIVFYLSFLPTFMDLQALSIADIVIITTIIVVVIGSVMMAYAYAAVSAKKAVISHQSQRWGKNLVGSLMAATGGWLLIRN